MEEREDFRHQPLTAPVEALDLFASVLSEVDAAEPSSEFYDRLAEATCRLAAMRRAVIFFYDDERRQVRLGGVHGVDRALFENLRVTAESVDLVRRALDEDRVVEVSEQFERELPSEYLRYLQGGVLTCTPMSAGGRWIGVIIADRAPEQGPLTEAQRHTLWSLGKVCALASAARIATRQHELARQLAQRIDLARELHEQVVHRLFGVSLALSGEGPLSTETRARAREELQAALGELREILQRPLARTARATVATLAEEIERLRHEHEGVPFEVLGIDRVSVPPGLEPLAQSVLREAIRNARKHAEPTAITIHVAQPDGVFVLDVINDGVRSRVRRTGMGLRLAAFEALEHGGVVEFGAVGEDHWRVRLAVPLSDVGLG